MNSLKIQQLFIYPIKSCAGIEVDELVFEKAGPQWDRNWVIVDENFKFITQRQFPKMALIKTQIKTDHLEIKLENETFQIPLKQENSQTQEIQVWKANITAHLEKPDVNHKISEFLGGKFQLMRFGKQSHREVMIKDVSQNAQVKFSDGMPVLLMNQKSLQDLNTRLEKPVPMNRFRPNLVVDFGQAYDEDRWQKASTQNLEFDFSTRCSRCAITTVDQETGIVTGPDPLATLAKYRREDRGIYLGRYMIHRSLGALRKGQELTLS